MTAISSANAAILGRGATSPKLGMYLHTLKLTNFRSCVDTEIKFRPGLTVIVGENNSGKSNIIEALRLSTSPLSGRRFRYFDSDDLSTGASPAKIELTTCFDNVTSAQRGHYTSAYDLESEQVWYTVRHDPDETKLPRLRTAYLAGKHAGPDQEQDSRERINHVYLEPLRDAQKALDSASSSRIGQIIKYLTEKERQDDFVAQANQGMRELEQHSVVTDTVKELQSHVGRLTDAVRGQNVGLSFNDFKLHRLARSLRLKMAENDISLADLAESGLGYANLLYIATVILELRNAKESELTLFLVEEPEAHLHPQLQAVLLDYLQEQAESSVQDDRDRPAGRIQVIATTHSPNLASAVGIENIVALRPGSISRADAAVPEPNTVALPLVDAPLSADERRKINQYLDVTRAELLFGRRAILVVGIAEAVLLPALAHKVLFVSPEDAKSRQAFHAVSIINVGSVDFAPYIKLLTYHVSGVRLIDRLAIITDRDPVLATDDDGEETETIRTNRKGALDSVIAECGAAEMAFVYEARYTLEADLLEPVNPNASLLYEAFKNQKPGSDRQWSDFLAEESPARAFYRKMRNYKGDYLGKGEFAHDVSALLRDGQAFKCPDYLERAIRETIG